MCKLAIVIPYYKSDFFKDTLASLQNQVNKNFNLYIGDDASNVPAIDIIQQSSFNINYKLKRFDNNLGATNLIAQWDRCIAMINHEPWICILGDDDVLPANFVQTFYEALEKVDDKNNVVIKYATQLIDNIGMTISSLNQHSYNLNVIEHTVLKLMQKGRSSLSEHIFKTASYERIGFENYKLAWHADDKAWLEFSNWGYFHVINNSIVKIRVSSQSISGATHHEQQKKSSENAFYRYLILHRNFKRLNKQQKHFLLKKSFNFTRSQNTFNVKIGLFFFKQFLKLNDVKFCRKALKHLVKHLLDSKV